MRFFLLFVAGLAFGSSAMAQDSLNMIRLARWDDDSLPIDSPNNLRVQYSGCWGLAVNGREYAILGGARHVLVFDITTPTAPQLVGKFEGKTNTVWREYKSYKNRIYGVSDATTEGLMILDFNNAPDTIVRTYYSNALFNSAHTITLDTVSGRIYLNGTNAVNRGLLVLDISQDPDNPTLLSADTLPGGYIHDSYVRNDTVYASSGFNGFYVYDYTNPTNPKTIASLLSNGYQHNNWLTADGRYAFCTEEIPSGRPILVVDLQDMSNANLEVAHTFLDPLLPPGGQYNAIPHNVYIRDNLLFDSQYEDGLVVYDISEPTAPVRIGYYDTHPENTQYNTYYGCWGNYPWLPSGTIIAGDMQNGLQLLKLTNTSATTTPAPPRPFRVYPNPARAGLTVSRSSGVSAGRLRLINLAGQLVLEQPWPAGETSRTLNIDQMTPGLYLLEITDRSGRFTEKIVIE